MNFRDGFMGAALLCMVTVANSAANARTQTNTNDLLVKLAVSPQSQIGRLVAALPKGSKIESLGVGNWARLQIPSGSQVSLAALQRNPAVAFVQPNYPIRILENPDLAAQKDKVAALLKSIDGQIPAGPAITDNPAIPAPGDGGSGGDPLIDSQWGMLDIGAKGAWQKQKGSREVVVAVIDTGVDYTHEDLRGNLWRNPGETGTDASGRDKSTNGVDDDHNGYIDDLIGWDFVTNDNKPFDLSVSMFELFSGGNPGHGTHCAGNVAARGFNGKGISGVAPNVSIMAIRFLSEKGQGTTADAVKAVKYAIDNHAQVLSNSWGSEGEEAGDPENEALKDVIRYSESKGALFVAAAGNGHNGVGYDNDSDAKPGVPASYDMDVIVSVAAIDSSDQMGSFSNWGARSVDIAAPGVAVFSTMVDHKYSDKVIDYLGIKMNWDGTSMATPHVAGAAALYLSQNPGANWKDVKNALMRSAVPIASMSGKSTTGGKLNLDKLMN